MAQKNKIKNNDYKNTIVMKLCVFVCVYVSRTYRNEKMKYNMYIARVAIRTHKPTHGTTKIKTL